MQLGLGQQRQVILPSSSGGASLAHAPSADDGWCISYLHLPSHSIFSICCCISRTSGLTVMIDVQTGNEQTFIHSWKCVDFGLLELAPRLQGPSFFLKIISPSVGQQ